MRSYYNMNLDINDVIEIIKNDDLNALHKYECEYVKYDDRVLISCKKFTRNLKHNGLVLAIQTLEVVSCPPQSMLMGIPSTVSSVIATATYDGTTCTLYWWNDSWRMSTIKSVDAGDMVQYGCKISNIKALNECLEDSDLFYSSLDKSISYTIGFHHTDIHPHGSTNYAWLIQATDKLGNAITTLNLPISKPIKRVFSNIQDIKKELHDALNNYILTEEALFGYVIEYNNNRYLANSSLMEYIRNKFYKRGVVSRFTKANQDLDKPNPTEFFSKIHYITLERYLANDKVFFKVFTNLNAIIHNYDINIGKIVDQTADNLDNNISSIIIESIKSHISIASIKKHKFIIGDYIKDVDNIEMLYTELSKYMPEMIINRNS